MSDIDEFRDGAAYPFVVVDLVDLVCEACDTEFEAARPDPDEPFVICGSCAVPA